MAKYPLDDRTLDRLLTGSMEPEDAPAGYGEVVRLVRAAQAPASSAELSREQTVVSMAAAAAISNPVQAPAAPQAHRRKRMVSKLAAVRAAAMTAAAVLGAGAAAAAATGSLPGQGASHASSTAGKVLASNPTTTTDANKNQGGDSKSPIVIGGVSFSATGPANGHAVPGLCQALESQFATDPTSPSFTHAKPFETLISKTGGTPTAANTWCKANTTAAPDTETSEPPDTDANKPSGTSSPDSHAPSSTPPVPTPNSGGTGTANTASGGASENGTSTANTDSGGHSSAGSANATGH